MATVQFGDSRLPERFWAKIRQADNGCWEWTGAIGSRGYAMFGWGTSKSALGHRVSYEMLVGPIPDKHQIDHTCHGSADPPCLGGNSCPHRACVNPAHLEPVTPRTNLMRGQTLAAKNVAATHCPKGHEYTEANTRILKPRGVRCCRECGNEWQRKNGKASRDRARARGKAWGWK